MPRRHHHRVYVIELDPRVWNESARFRRANPQRDPGKPCVYVGSTGLPIAERFANHLAGHRSSSIVKRYGRELRPDLWEGLKAMSWKEAERMERVLAKQLRADGYGVWQN